MLMGPRLWNFTQTVLSDLDPNIYYKYVNPIPVFSGPKLVGCGVIYEELGSMKVEGFLDYAIPERLDAENGVSWWLLPRAVVELVTINSPNRRTCIKIEALELRNDCSDPTLTPIILP